MHPCLSTPPLAGIGLAYPGHELGDKGTPRPGRLGLGRRNSIANAKSIYPPVKRGEKMELTT